MKIEIEAHRAMIAALRKGGARGAWLELLSEVLRVAGPKAEFVRHSERPWASVTFGGSRHSVRLVFVGAPAVADGERFVVALPDHEFNLRGRLVAEATIGAIDHDLTAGPRLTVDAELLVLDDA